jgi:hypothetical protein
MSFRHTSKRGVIHSGRARVEQSSNQSSVATAYVEVVMAKLREMPLLKKPKHISPHPNQRKLLRLNWDTQQKLK